MGKLILTLLGALIIMIGVTMLFDARKIATKTFSSGETNETTKILTRNIFTSFFPFNLIFHTNMISVLSIYLIKFYVKFLQYITVHDILFKCMVNSVCHIITLIERRKLNGFI